MRVVGNVNIRCVRNVEIRCAENIKIRNINISFVGNITAGVHCDIHIRSTWTVSHIYICLDHCTVEISTSSRKPGVSFVPPTTISLLPGRTATRHSDRRVAMRLRTSQELVSGLYRKIVLVFLLSKSLYPPTASSCPFSATQVERTTGRSVMVCHSWWSWASDIFASVVCDWRTLREQVMTIFVVLCRQYPPTR